MHCKPDDKYYPRSDWTLPTEAFAIRHEILDRSPPPEQFPDHHQSVSLREDTHTIQIDDQLPGMLANMQTCKKPSYGPSSIVIDFLHHYATLGDVQTVACILIVLGDSRKYLTGNWNIIVIFYYKIIFFRLRWDASRTLAAGLYRVAKQIQALEHIESSHQALLVAQRQPAQPAKHHDAHELRQVPETFAASRMVVRSMSHLRVWPVQYLPSSC